MVQTATDFGALIGSRICHDLISPVGAIGNGLELLGLTGATDGPELDLISQSVENANARIRFFRVAFGYCSDGQAVSLKEIQQILMDMSESSRTPIYWEHADGCMRSDLQAVFLGIMCAETALAFGGAISVSHDQGAWKITAQSERLKVDVDLWQDMAAAQKTVPITPDKVQFGLLPKVLSDLGRTHHLTLSPTHLCLTF